MKKVFGLSFLVLISCGQQKSAESVVVIDSAQQDSLVELVADSIALTAPSVSEPEIEFEIISITDNIALSGVANYPFSKDSYAIKSMLDSMGVESEFIDGENGGLSYDSADISCNRSYGESICEANIQSSLITLSNGMKIGTSLYDFMTLTGIRSSLSEQNVRYEYTYIANEHTFIIQFDFTRRKLSRFHYQKDPCVIYD